MVESITISLFKTFYSVKADISRDQRIITTVDLRLFFYFNLHKISF